MPEFRKCPKCSRQYAEQLDLDKHYEEMHSTKSGYHKCDSCSREFSDLKELHKHQRSHYYQKHPNASYAYYQKKKAQEASAEETSKCKRCGKTINPVEYILADGVCGECFREARERARDAYNRAQRERAERIASGYNPYAGESPKYSSHPFFNPDATEEEIKKEFRRLAMKYHPDKNPSADAASAFIRFKQDYDNALERAQRRARYV